MNTNSIGILGVLNLDIVDLKYSGHIIVNDSDNILTETPRYLYLCNDILSNWTYAEFHNCRTPIEARKFLDRLIVKVPFKIKRIFTDNDIVFTACPSDLNEGAQNKSETFSQVCKRHSIDHIPLHFFISDQGDLIQMCRFLLLEHLEGDFFNSFDELEYALTEIAENCINDIDKEYLIKKVEEWNAYIDSEIGHPLTKTVEEWNAYLNPQKLVDNTSEIDD